MREPNQRNFKNCKSSSDSKSTVFNTFEISLISWGFLKSFILNFIEKSVWWKKEVGFIVLINMYIHNEFKTIFPGCSAKFSGIEITWMIFVMCPILLRVPFYTMYFCLLYRNLYQEVFTKAPIVFIYDSLSKSYISLFLFSFKLILSHKEKLTKQNL